ncbi:MAG: diguanylate cyclase [Candidatus Latescibacteria bacterium]|nr:diguanylate cyclase [Candidatus Latescibacterota bacterium]
MASSNVKKNNDSLPVVRDINDLSRLFVRTLKEISAKGENLTLDTLAKSLEKREEIANLIALANPGKDTLALPLLEDEIERLRKTVDRKEEERRKVTSRLFDSENLLDRERDFAKRLSLTLIRLSMSGENLACHSLLDRYKRLLMDDANLEDREQVLSDLKNLIVKMEMNGSLECVEEEKSSKLADLLNLPKKDPLRAIRKAGLQSLSDLLAIVGKKYGDDIEIIRRRVIGADDLDYLLSLRKSVIQLIETYAADTEQEKESLTGFLHEISEKLVALEKSLAATTEASTQFNRANLKFNETLDTDIEYVKQEVTKKNQFEDLKQAVIERLEKISTTLSFKRDEYVIRIEDSEKEQVELQKHFKNVITSLQNKNRILQEQSSRDPLTGIFNRRVFKERLDVEFDRFIRYRTGFSLLFFDIDNFKQVNDTYGHEAGDRALKGIAVSTQEILRKTDVFARYGGEEFVVILFETDIDQAIIVAEKLRGLIENAEFIYDGRRVPITISIGVTESRDSDPDGESVVKRADFLLYQAKGRGRNRVVSDLEIPPEGG